MGESAESVKIMLCQGRELSDLPAFSHHISYTPRAGDVNDKKRALLEHRHGLDQSNEKAVYLFGSEEFGDFGETGIPYQFLDLLGLAQIRRDLWYYWWRAQSIAYIMRPNDRTRFQLEMHREQMAKWGKLPPGTISVQIRHGDKATEATLAEDELYLQDVRRLLSELPELKPSVYMVTLDNQSVTYFNQQPDLVVYYTDIPRIAHSNDNIMSAIKEPW
jgi:hypothetical protein